MVVAIHQPHYLPYLGYFHKMALADVFVFLDDAQFEKNGWQNRNKIKGNKGEIWLTVPVFHKSNQLIKDVKIRNDIPWQRKHKNTIITYYSKAKGFREVFAELETLWTRKWEKLVDVAVESTMKIAKMLGINTKTIFSSELGVETKKTQRLVDICKKLGADTYLSGQGAKAYLDESLFEKEGIKVVWQNFVHPTYTQLWGNFIPNLSAIDLLLNEGIENSRKIFERTLRS